MAVMMRTMLEVADNSGARKLQMILPLGGSTGLNADLGDIITAAVKESAPEGQVQKGKVVKAVIVRTRKEHERLTPGDQDERIEIWQLQPQHISE